MEIIKAQKVATQEMVPVTPKELKELMVLNPWISLGQYDLENSDFTSSEIIGYVAGDVRKLVKSTEDITDNAVRDCWFINSDFFNKNYKIKG